jgi:hypothetical protein
VNAIMKELAGLVTEQSSIIGEKKLELPLALMI